VRPQWRRAGLARLAYININSNNLIPLTAGVGLRASPILSE